MSRDATFFSPIIIKITLNFITLLSYEDETQNLDKTFEITTRSLMVNTRKSKGHVQR